MSAFSAGGLLLVLYAMKGLFPFGEYTISWCDMNQQVVPLLCEFKDILEGKGSLFLNLQNAGGMNFWGVFLFFISSPFTFLVAFVEKWQMMRFANILVLLKMMLCAGCASIFFDRVFPKLRPVFVIILSVSYAFCGYTMLFYQNMVWLDMMYLFPLFLLSLRRLAKTGSLVPYAFSLAAMIAVNFYLGYMLVLFLILAAGIWILFFSPRATPRPKDGSAGRRDSGGGFAFCGDLDPGPFAIFEFRPGRKSVPEPWKRQLYQPAGHDWDASFMHLYYDPRLFVSVVALCQGGNGRFQRSLYTGAFCPDAYSCYRGAD